MTKMSRSCFIIVTITIAVAVIGAATAASIAESVKRIRELWTHKQIEQTYLAALPMRIEFECQCVNVAQPGMRRGENVVCAHGRDTITNISNTFEIGGPIRIILLMRQFERGPGRERDKQWWWSTTFETNQSNNRNEHHFRCKWQRTSNALTLIIINYCRCEFAFVGCSAAVC